MRLRRTFAAIAVAALYALAACQSGAPVPVPGPTASASGAKTPAAGTCALKRLASLPLAEVDHKLLLPVTIDGKESSFYIDTGFYNDLTLFRGAADALGLPQTRMEAKNYGVSGETTLGLASVQQFDLGGQIKWPPLRIPTVRTAGSYVPNSPSGLIGNGLFKDLDIEFDLADKSFNLFSPQHCAGHVVYWHPDLYLTADFDLASNNQIMIPIEADGKPEHAMLDSGMSVTAMTWERAHDLGITLQTPGVRPSNKLSGIGPQTVASWVYTLPKLVIGDETLTNIPINIFNPAADWRGRREKDGTPEIRTADMWIGADFLEKNRVFIAFEEHKIYFSPYKYTFAAPAPSPS